MSTDSTIALLIGRAQEAYDEATRVLGLATSARDQQEQKLQMLQGYRVEYQNRLTQSASGGMAIGELLNFRRFLTQLDQAVEQQGQACQQSQRALGLAQQRWQECRRQLKSFEILARRRSVAADRVAAKREQRESDGYAARIAAARKSPL